MDELDSLESNDALLRFREGGGPVPSAMHKKFPLPYPYGVSGLQGLGQQDISGTPWYKSKTFFAVTGVGIAAVLLTIFFATSKDGDDSDSDGGEDFTDVQ